MLTRGLEVVRGNLIMDVHILNTHYKTPITFSAVRRAVRLVHRGNADSDSASNAAESRAADFSSFQRLYKY